MSEPHESLQPIKQKTKKRPSSLVQLRDRQTLEVTKLLKEESPENIRNLVDGTIQIIQATSPDLIMATSDAKRRYAGLWIGALFSILALGGGVGILISAAPAAAGIGLLVFGVVCAGATFAIATGKSVDMAEFSRSFADLSQILTRSIKADDRDQN